MQQHYRFGRYSSSWSPNRNRCPPLPETDGEDQAYADFYNTFQSAYEKAVSGGYEGTFEEWLGTLFEQDAAVESESESEAGTGDDAVETEPMDGYVLITDYAKPDTGADLTDEIQKAIDENPNKTIFFPDGTYQISRPILTPADPTKSVSLKLSNYAKIQANKNWRSSEAMIRLGGKNGSAEEANDISVAGNCYFFEGGIVDGSGKANGISIDSGRETRVANVSIKNTRIGLYIKHGINSGSSDADIFNVNIFGNKAPGSVGVLVEGFDNTLTNMRIAGVQYGVHLTGGGNFIRNVHPLYIFLDGVNYADTVGFWEQTGGNFYDNAYSDQFATAFKLEGYASILNGCYAFWYADFGQQIGFYCTGTFNSMITNARIDFNARSTNDAIFFYTAEHGNGSITSPFFFASKCDPAQNNYGPYLADEDIVGW